MCPRALLAVTLLAAAAHAQTYDVDGDGDIDSDDWEATAPPMVDADGQSGEAQSGYAEEPPSQEPTQQEFQQQLSGYGAWYDEPGVGQVWQPAPSVVGYEFTPYSTGGSWVSSPYGWQFASTYGFGSAPFHYGRWYRSPRYGWVWWPQRTWGPSWVDWRCNRSGNVAWAPLAPPGIQVGFGLGAPGWSFAFGRYHHPRVTSVPSYYAHRWGGGFRGGYGYSTGHYGGGYRAPHYGYGNSGGYHSASPAGGRWSGGTSRGSGGFRGGGGFHGGGGGRHHR